MQLVIAEKPSVGVALGSTFFRKFEEDELSEP